MGTRSEPEHEPEELESALPPAERRRIIAEEEFRRRIGVRIERDLSSKRERVLRVLNAPVTIWLLSSVVVGLATWSYQRWSERSQEKQERVALQARSTTELLSRLSACDWIDTSSTRDDVENLLSAVIGLRPLFSEYEKRNLPDVYLEFCSLTGQCPISRESLLTISAGIRRIIWPEIVGQRPRPLSNRGILTTLQNRCRQLAPLRTTVATVGQGSTK